MKTRSNRPPKWSTFCKRRRSCAGRLISSACAVSGKPVNIKKGQFLAPGDMKNVIDKARDAAREAGLPEDRFMTCERGASFGNNLVPTCDRWRSCAIPTRRWCSTPRTPCNCPADRARPAAGSANSCRSWHGPRLPRGCAWPAETHPNPAEAKSDGPNAVPLDRMKELLETLVELDRVTKKNGFIESSFSS